MIERDVIMRMVQQLSAALAKVLLQRDAGQYDEAFKELDDACRGLIGMKWDFLRTFSGDQLSALLNVADHPAKVLAASELLRGGSEVFAHQGRAEESTQQAMKAFSLFVELVEQDRRYLKFVSVEKFSALVEGFEGLELSDDLLKKRFRFYEITGELAKARAALAAAVAQDPAFRKEETAFFQRQAKLSDDELQKGGLARQEVSEALAAARSPRRRGH